MTPRVVEELVKLAHKAKAAHQGRPILLGVSGCQGSGKTYCTQLAAEILGGEGIKAIALSVDDFYVPNQEQNAIAARGNRLLQKRGLPGTHDTPLMYETLVDLKQGGNPQVPVYDKAKHSGAGDRVDMHQLPPGLEVIFFEGWFTGFRALGSSRVREHRETASDHTQLYSLEELYEVDTRLEDFTKVWDTLDALFYIKPKDLDFVYAWRRQQEHNLIAQKGQGMSDDQVNKFVDQYMPVYDLYSNNLVFDEVAVLDFDRNVVKFGSDLNN